MDDNPSIGKRKHCRLTDLQIQNAKPGVRPDGTPKTRVLPDGDGLYLQVSPGVNGAVSRSWIYRYSVAGKDRQLGLGSLKDVSLAEARQKTKAARGQRAEKIDPITQRRKEDSQRRTFAECVTEFIKTHEVEWRGTRTKEEWEQSLRQHACPIIGGTLVDQIDRDAVLRVLKPKWNLEGIRLAVKLRQRIEAVLRYATRSDYRTGTNPASWEDSLKGKLAEFKPQLKRVRKHHPAYPYKKIAGFVAQVRVHEGAHFRALELVILTGVRASQARLAKWSEFDFETGTWTIPLEAKRSKTFDEPHRVPLSSGVLRLLAGLDKSSEYLFPAVIGDSEVIGDAAIRQASQLIDPAFTPHGFRSTFVDWAANNGVPFDQREKAIGHQVGSKASQAYQRDDLLEPRRPVMESWSRWCDGVGEPPASTGDNVVQLRRKAS
jgi:integrase